MTCKHKWMLSDGAFQQKIIARYRADDTSGNCYVSKKLIHYWEITECESCGEKRMISAGLDRKDVEPISDAEFDWFNAFLTPINKRAGNIDTKIKLINYAMDSMPWQRPPMFGMHNDDYNYFYLSFDTDPMNEDPNKKFDWEFYDAIDMIKEMKECHDSIMIVNKVNADLKSQGIDVDNMQDGDVEKLEKMNPLSKLFKSVFGKE